MDATGAAVVEVFAVFLRLPHLDGSAGDVGSAEDDCILDGGDNADVECHFAAVAVGIFVASWLQLAEGQGPGSRKFIPIEIIKRNNRKNESKIFVRLSFSEFES